MVWHKHHVSGQVNPNKCLRDSVISGRIHDHNFNYFIEVLCVIALNLVYSIGAALGIKSFYAE